MKRLKLSLVAALAGSALLGCAAQQNSNGGSRTAERPGAAPSQPRTTPQSSYDAAGHDHAAETAVPRINIAEAEAAVKRGEAVFLDVRQVPAYNAGHIKGAILMPETEIPSRAMTLPKGKKIITYCT